ncbi:aldehyde dehydrogenase [Desulfosporosinus sp. BICA1-9]|uniref:aldehyde dehydrogenase family protein n=1 Tax=Desulfosporosinus sp. BICA1-9 TaxID=1531958 RepID=UPI00054BD29B|nr:aldehyde dehydrogenase family protein [Desulfosporosinus sp. BICA1-9]KJS46086.1 MAG: aldehyde dehydrogenase [Peptococcaceae bacterium BRH_c23]KJS88541.1 MAG: aldehyde dehydrogenase [Desulfosporosinus sp. BICA1-9]HBW35131.1 aldehyde dehydrogenase [Desulfosporosinus sp.]
MSQFYPLFIGGRKVPALSGATFEVINPSNGEVCATVARAGLEDVNEAVRVARQTFESGTWSRVSHKERANIMFRIADMINKRAHELATLESMQSGGTLRRTMGSDVLQLPQQFAIMGQILNNFPIREELPCVAVPGPSINIIEREPIGICGLITPWNFPMILAGWKLAPAIAMGNAIVIKPASNTPLTTLLLAEIFQECGLPDGVVNVVAGPGALIGEAIVTHPEVDKISFTGSTAVGRRIMQLASHTVKRLTLELGGKSPAIMLRDADLDLVSEGALFATFLHSGQICESGTRLLVPRELQDDIVDRLIAKASTIAIGNAMELTTGMGPIVSKTQRDTILNYIQAGIEEGAVLAYGGKIPDLPAELAGGFYIQPTIFKNVDNSMKIAQEEIFGPVLCVIPYDTEGDAIRIANDSIYGLAAGVWSKDITRAQNIGRKLRAGTVWINDWHMLRPDAPFGGYKQSGFGRESGYQVLFEYSQTKHMHTSMVPDVNQRFWHQLLFDSWATK